MIRQGFLWLWHVLCRLIEPESMGGRKTVESTLSPQRRAAAMREQAVRAITEKNRLGRRADQVKQDIDRINGRLARLSQAGKDEAAERTLLREKLAASAYLKDLQNIREQAENEVERVKGEIFRDEHAERARIAEDLRRKADWWRRQ